MSEPDPRVLWRAGATLLGLGGILLGLEVVGVPFGLLTLPTAFAALVGGALALVPGWALLRLAERSCHLVVFTGHKFLCNEEGSVKQDNMWYARTIWGETLMAPGKAKMNDPSGTATTLAPTFMVTDRQLMRHAIGFPALDAASGPIDVPIIGTGRTEKIPQPSVWKLFDIGGEELTPLRRDMTLFLPSGRVMRDPKDRRRILLLPAGAN